MINIMDVQPHKVSSDMRGYSVFFFGDPKAGKTTIATKFPKHLLLGFEKGWSAIPGAMALPINNWAEFKQVLIQLNNEAAKEKYETIIIDTADIAYDYCTKYVCNQNDVDTVADIPYGKGYSLISSEFDSSLRKILQMNYGLVIISHSTDKTFKDEKGIEFNKIVPTLDKRANNIVSRLCDIIGYARAFEKPDGSITTKLFMRGTPRFEAGSRFKYTPTHIDFSYKNLVNAIGEAIDKQMEEEGEELFTDTIENKYADTTSQLNFDELMAEFNTIIKYLIENYGDEIMASYYQPRISEIVSKYLGRGKKVSNMKREQVESLVLILDDLKAIPEPSNSQSEMSGED